MNSRIWLFGLVAVATAALVVVGIVLLTGNDTGAPSSSPGAVTHTPGSMGSLAYGVDGDIYVADWDGSNPVRIANGVPNVCGGTFEYWAEGPTWSPDGNYLAYRH